jgi:chromosome segregation ATPase
MTDNTRALEDLTFLTKRFAGIVELGNSIQEAQVLLGQRNDLEKSVAKLSDELSSIEENIDGASKAEKAANLKLKQVETEVDNASNRRTAALKQFDQEVIAMKRDKANMEKEMEEFKAHLLNQIQTEAENLKAALVKETAQEQAKLDAVKDQIEKFKNKLS